MELFRFLVFLEQRAIELQSSCQMVQGLLVVSVVEIGFSELSVCFHEDEEVFSMNVYQDFTHCQLLHSHLNLAVEVLG